MIEDRVYCANPKYRNAVASLATSAFHVSLESPKEGASDDEYMKYVELVNAVEQQITHHAERLSKKYKVPVLSVHADIRECVNFLPRKDLARSYFARKHNKLN